MDEFLIGQGRRSLPGLHRFHQHGAPDAHDQEAAAAGSGYGRGAGGRFQRTQTRGLAAAYIYEPGEQEILDEIVPRFTALQVYQAILESLASEHAARMVAMKNATDSASELAGALTLEYNKARQQSITNEMLDIAGGAEALAKRLNRSEDKH